MHKSSERWASRAGVILVVASSAIGLGNFLRFPGQAVQYGGGAFMVPYILSFILLGLPVCLSEWVMGRMGGKDGHSAPNIFKHFLSGFPLYVTSAIAILIPILIYTYYVFIESWCLTYAVDFLMGTINLHPASAKPGIEYNSAVVATSSNYFTELVGSQKNGSAFNSKIIYFTLFCYFLNFFLIYRGLVKGLEAFAKVAVPVLLVCSFIVLVRVLTLDNIWEGLGKMWNPDWSALLRGQVWLAAAGQIFFSLSVGFGIVLTFSSYLTERDDVVLSGLSAASLNEFVEVVLGGLITIPVGFIFLGASVASYGTFGMGFVALPAVFSLMPLGQIFGAVWFFILFIAAITSSLSMIQPGITFLEEGFNLNKKQAVSILSAFTLSITMSIVYFSKDLSALDQTDFWVGIFFIYVLATIQVLIYGWKIGPALARIESKKGSLMHLPKSFDFIIKYITPALLLIIFAIYAYNDLPTYLLKMSADHMLSIAPAGSVPEDVIMSAHVSKGVFITLLSIFILLIYLSYKSHKWETKK